MQQAIFIIGVSPRCGTNFLHKLLLLHPEISASMVKGEDFFLAESDLLVNYSNRINDRWKSEWGNSKDKVLQGLGDGLIAVLAPKNQTAKYVVTKTPIPQNLDHFSSLFGERAKLILLCRKGQDICESYRKSFQPDLDKVLDIVQEGVQSLTAYLDKKNNKYLLVRYEDLVTNLAPEIERLLNYLNLPHEIYPLQEAKGLDVVGSSMQRTKNDRFVWKRLPKTANFNSTERAKNWSKREHYRFNWRVGKHFKQLGYATLYHDRSILFYLYNWYCNIKRLRYFFFHKKVKPFVKRLLNC